jgi:hypothetical protein
MVASLREAGVGVGMWTWRADRVTWLLPWQQLGATIRAARLDCQAAAHIRGQAERHPGAERHRRVCESWLSFPCCWSPSWWAALTAARTRPPGPVTGPIALVGNWRVTGTDEPGGYGAAARRRRGPVAVAPLRLSHATAYRLAGADRELLDGGGEVVARLLH